ISDQCVTTTMFFMVQMQLAVRYNQLKEGSDVSRVHLTGVVRNSGGEVHGTQNGDAIDLHCLSGSGEFAVSSGFSGEIHDDRSPAHSSDHLLSDEYGGFFPWNRRRCDDRIAFCEHLCHHLSLPAIEILIHSLCVSASGLGFFTFTYHFDEFRPQTFVL